MKNIYIGFALLLFGNIIANIPGDRYWLTAIGLGILGCIILAFGIHGEFGKHDGNPADGTKNTDRTPDNRENESLDGTNNGKA